MSMLSEQLLTRDGEERETSFSLLSNYDEGIDGGDPYGDENGDGEGDTQPLNPKPLFAAPRRRSLLLHPEAARRAWRKKVCEDCVEVNVCFVWLVLCGQRALLCHTLRT